MMHNSKRRPIPINFIKTGSQPYKIIRFLNEEVPERIDQIPCKRNDWYKHLNFFTETNNERKIIQRAVPFLYYIKSKKLDFEDINIYKAQLIIDYFVKVTDAKLGLMGENSLFQWLYAIKVFLSLAYDLDYDLVPGRKRIDKTLATMEKFGAPITSVEPYPIEFFEAVYKYHPEEGEELVEKILTLGPFFSPVRESQLDKCVFSNMTHDLNSRTVSFFEQKSKTGKAFFVITDVGRFSVYRLMYKYLGMISTKYQTGGVWRHWTRSLFKGSKGYYSPGKRFKKKEFTLLRKKMEHKYLSAFSYDIFYEEVTGSKLPNTLRSCNINKNYGIDRLGAKSKRKSYATLNVSNNLLNDEQLSKGYWKSKDVFRNSEMEHKYYKNVSNIKKQKELVDYLIKEIDDLIFIYI